MTKKEHEETMANLKPYLNEIYLMDGVEMVFAEATYRNGESTLIFTPVYQKLPKSSPKNRRMDPIDFIGKYMNA